MTTGQDTLLGVTVAVVGAGLAWGFWWLLGKDGFLVLAVLSNVGLMAELRRVKRQLRDAKRE